MLNTLKYGLVVSLSLASLVANAESLPEIMDMVHNNPGEAPFETKYNSPEFLKSAGFSGTVTHWHINCAIDYAGFDSRLTPAGSDERRWIDAKAARIDSMLSGYEAAEVPVYPFTDFLVFPASVWELYGDSIRGAGSVAGTGGSNERARKPDISRPFTRRLLRYQIDRIFERFPTLGGITLRFGETYLHDTPFHMGGSPIRGGKDAIADHIDLINLLREEVCVKRGKKLFYRTWDFGYNFHNNPDFYLSVTDAIEPHPLLFFSIKYQQNDYHRMTPFNPALGRGRHQQVVESQSRMEAYGKGAHPYYTAKGVIDGWPETALEIEFGTHRFTGRDNAPEAPRGLRDVADTGLLKGVMTWSHGGGWQGPYINHEIWTDLNTFVVARWAADTSRSEEDIFREFCDSISLHGYDAYLFRQIALMSVEAVRKGHCNSYTHNDVWWTRDEFFSASANGHVIDAILAAKATGKVLAEKDEAAHMWSAIEAMSRQIDCEDQMLKEAITVSCTYGRIKYHLIREMWRLMIYSRLYADGDTALQTEIRRSIAAYDALWAEWRSLKEASPLCATLYTDMSFRNERKGSMGEFVDSLRSI